VTVRVALGGVSLGGVLAQPTRSWVEKHDKIQ
jgi:hypothetical protein